MFTKQVRLFRLLGFEVKLDLSWLLLAVLITWSLAEGLFPFYMPGLTPGIYWTLGVLGTLGLLVSIVFHEFSHSLVARRYGMPIKGITLFLFGGVAEMDEEPVSPKAEFLMAVAGPIASLFLAGVLYAVVVAAGGRDGWFTGLIYYLAYLNVILAIFNLVPAFPLDGGRMFRAALWGWKKNLRDATRMAARFGSGFGIVLIVLGLLSVLQGNLIGGLWWFLIGMFLRAAANMSYQQVVVREAVKGEKVSRFMNDSPVTVSPDITLQQLVDDYIYKYHFKLFPVVDHDALRGYVSTQEVKQVPRDQWGQRRVGEVVVGVSDESTIAPGADALEALSRMQRNRNSRLLVVDDQGHLAGILAMKDLMELLNLKMDLEQARHA